MSGHDLIARSVVSGNDLDQARAMYEQEYNGRGFATERTDLPFAFRYTITGRKNMTLRSSMFLGAISGDIQPEKNYTVAWLTQGDTVFTIGQDKVPLVLGSPAMFPTGTTFHFTAHNVRRNLIQFDAAFVEQIAAEHENLVPAALSFDHAFNPDKYALRLWKTVVDEAAQLVLNGEPTPLQLAEAERRTAVALLDNFPHSGTELPPQLLVTRDARLRQAVEFIHAHAHLPVSPTQIAHEVGFSIRGLQRAFERQLDDTPLGYLHQVRLDRAREDLLKLSSRETTVVQVAARWGFPHASRFAHAYNARFGENPGTTLRR